MRRLTRLLLYQDSPFMLQGSPDTMFLYCFVKTAPFLALDYLTCGAIKPRSTFEI